MVYKCSKCGKEPLLKKTWGCEEPTGEPVEIEKEDGVIYKYFNCPLKFIPNSVVDFIRVMQFHTAFPNCPMPKYEDVSLRFLTAFYYYSEKKAEFIKEKMRRDGIK